MYAVPSVAVAIILAALCVRDRSAMATAGILLGNWAACALMYYTAGDVTNWVALASIDYVSAVVLALIAVRGWQLAVVALYAGMLVLHVAYSLHDIFRVGITPLQYFDALTVLAWLQLVAVGGWLALDRAEALRSWRRAEGGTLADPAVRHTDAGSL